MSRATVALALLAVGLLAAPAGAQRLTTQESPAWTSGATCYEVFVRSFRDSDGDGIGDLNGLVEKLDYINDGNPQSTRSLGARCIWLMPVMASPSYHGYDVTDFYRVNPQYGTNADFRRLVAEAHRRGIRVLVDMVPNHVSSEHPWFQSALRDTASPYRSWFRWSATQGPKNEWGGSNWHKSPVRDEYYYGFFWSGMPDLNYEEPAVLAEMMKIADFWLKDMGVDGFRLDAVRHLMEEGTRTMNVPATHDVLRKYAAHVRAVNPQAFTIGEVFDPISTVLSYYPDQLDSYFAFEVADSLVAAVRNGNARGLLAPSLRLQEELPATRYAPFLRNHDQPRTRTELGGDMAKARLASFLLLTLPGTPFVYYGEEIGMTGAKPDERLRTPMQWTAEPGAGFTSGRPWQQLANDSAVATVAAEASDPRSVLTMNRRLIQLRASNAALGRGTLVPLRASHDAAAAYVRRAGDQMVLVVANLGNRTLGGVTLAADAGALPPGTWAARSLLGGRRAAPVRVGPDGRLTGYVPLPALAPREGYLFELTRFARTGKD